MELEKIKSELETRVQNLISTKSRVAPTTFKKAALKSWKDKVAETENLVKEVYETLYDVLQKNGIQLLDNRELDGLISLLEPSVNDIIIKNIQD